MALGCLPSELPLTRPNLLDSPCTITHIRIAQEQHPQHTILRQTLAMNMTLAGLAGAAIRVLVKLQTWTQAASDGPH